MRLQILGSLVSEIGSSFQSQLPLSRPSGTGKSVKWELKRMAEY